MSELGLGASHREIGATVARLFEDVRARDQARRSRPSSGARRWRRRSRAVTEHAARRPTGRRARAPGAAAPGAGAVAAVVRADRGASRSRRGGAAPSPAGAVGGRPRRAPAPIAAPAPAAAPPRPEASLTPTSPDAIARARRSRARGRGRRGPRGRAATRDGRRRRSAAAAGRPRRAGAAGGGRRRARGGWRAGARHTTARIRSSSTPTGSRGSGPNACDRPARIAGACCSRSRSLLRRRRRGGRRARGWRGARQRPAAPPPRPRPRPRGATAPRWRRRSASSRYEEAQVARRERRLLDSRAALRICSRASCPAAVRADCVDWLDQVAHSLPSVVVTARARGADIFAVKVFIDGKLATEKLTRLRAGGRSRAAQVPLRIAALAGDRARGAGQRGREGPADRRRVRAAAAVARCCRRTRTPKPFRLERSDYVFGGIALAGFATLAYFGGTGLYDAHQLRTGCMPFCEHEDVQAVRTKLIIADIGLARRRSSPWRWACICMEKDVF